MLQYFAKNHHANVTHKNETLANHLINYLNNKLLTGAGDAEIDAIIAFFAPYVVAWNLGFITWHAAHNIELGTTVEMNNITDILVHTKAPYWSTKVYDVYPEGTPRAKSLLPHKRQAFITGTVDNKITGMGTFIEVIGTDTALATVKTDVSNFKTLYQTTNENHVKAIKDLGDKSKDQEVLRLSTTGAMLACEGSLMTKFFETPDKVDLFFDVAAMRRHANKKINEDGYLVFLLPSEIKLLDLRYVGTEIWEVTNEAEHDACIFFSSTSAVTTIPAIKYVMHSGETVPIDLSTLSRDQRFAFAANMSVESTGELNIVLGVKTSG